MADGAEMEMPRYVSHKTVHALEIANLTHHPDGSTTMSFMDEGYAGLTVPASSDLFARYKPRGGDFYVVYADGYKSLSPRKAFLDGYTKQN
jgi:hypothetical protein